MLLSINYCSIFAKYNIQYVNVMALNASLWYVVGLHRIHNFQIQIRS